MNDEFDILEIVDQEELLEIESGSYNISEVKPLNENKFLVSYSNPESKTLTLMDGNKETHNINISVAAAVSSYARIHMSQFKNNKDLPNLYYTDTDSTYFDGPLPDSFISSTILGKLKLDGIYDSQATVFLAPKVYALKNQETEIIKIKGLSKDSILINNINIEILDQLLHQNSQIKVNQDKWLLSFGLLDLYRKELSIF